MVSRHVVAIVVWAGVCEVILPWWVASVLLGVGVLIAIVWLVVGPRSSLVVRLPLLIATRIEVRVLPLRLVALVVAISSVAQNSFLLPILRVVVESCSLLLVLPPVLTLKAYVIVETIFESGSFSLSN